MKNNMKQIFRLFVLLMFTFAMGCTNYSNVQSNSYSVTISEQIDEAYENAKRLANSAYKHMTPMMDDIDATLEVLATKESKGDSTTIKITCRMTSWERNNPDTYLVNSCYDYVRTNWQ